MPHKKASNLQNTTAKLKVRIYAYLQCTAWCHPEDVEPTDCKQILWT